MDTSKYLIYTGSVFSCQTQSKQDVYIPCSLRVEGRQDLGKKAVLASFKDCIVLNKLPGKSATETILKEQPLKHANGEM